MLNFGQLADLIVRPARYFYKLADLGSRSIRIGCISVSRHDFEIKNNRNLLIRGSVYSQKPLSEVNEALIYLHCNSGCRIEGLGYLQFAIRSNFAFVTFDFTGSGISQGNYVSLGNNFTLQSHLLYIKQNDTKQGYFEMDDLSCVVNHIRLITQSSLRICLWGRSMGAVTALRYLQKNGDIDTVVLDSPFESLRSLILQIGKQKTKLPSIVIQVAFQYLKPAILQKAGFDISQIDLTKYPLLSPCPAIFLGSKNDSLVPFEQINSLYDRYKAEKQMFFIDQQHNQPRDPNLISNVFAKLRKLFSQSKQIKSGFYAFLPKPDSKKKLDLTIKCKSQKSLPTHNGKEANNLNLRSDTKVTRVQHRQISCFVGMPTPDEEQILEKGCKISLKKANDFVQKKLCFYEISKPRLSAKLPVFNTKAARQSLSYRDRPPLHQLVNKIYTSNSDVINYRSSK